jgi:hypothetical protein
VLWLRGSGPLVLPGRSTRFSRRCKILGTCYFHGESVAVDKGHWLVVGPDMDEALGGIIFQQLETAVKQGQDTYVALRV